MSFLYSGWKALVFVLAGMGLSHCSPEPKNAATEMPSEVKHEAIGAVTGLQEHSGRTANESKEAAVPFEIPDAPPFGFVERPPEYRDFPSPAEMERLQAEQFRELKEERATKGLGQK